MLEMQPVNDIVVLGSNVKSKTWEEGMRKTYFQAFSFSFQGFLHHLASGDLVFFWLTLFCDYSFLFKEYKPDYCCLC